MRTAQLDAYASTHHGLVTRDIAVRLGVSARSWFRSIESGALEQLHGGVARLAGAPHTREQAILAAVFGGGVGAMASHRSSAYLWGVERPEDDPIDIILPRRTRQATLDGVVVHRPRDLKELRPVVRRGIPTTSPLRMLLDLGAVDPRSVRAAMDEVLTTRVVRPAGIKAVLLRHAAKGRHGVGALRDAIEAAAIEGAPADSELERRMASLLRMHRLPPADFHQIVAGYEVDFRVRDSVVLIECDGWASHGLDRDQFEFDRLRDADLSAAGFVVVHFTWNQITGAPVKVARRLEEVLRQWAPELLATYRRAA